MSSPLSSIGGSAFVAPLALVLVRHGVTDMTLTHALSGSSQPGPSLNAAGRVQAAKAADAVHRIGRGTWERLPHASRVIASPMVRTQETAAAIGRRLGVGIETEDRLKEINFGEWEGLTAQEVAVDSAAALRDWRFGKVAAPGGEDFAQVGERLGAAMADLAAQHARMAADGDDAPRTWVCVSHAVAIKCLVGLAMDMDIGAWGAVWPLPASITILQLRVTPAGEIAERHLLCLGAPTD